MSALRSAGARRGLSHDWAAIASTVGRLAGRPIDFPRACRDSHLWRNSDTGNARAGRTPPGTGPRAGALSTAPFPCRTARWRWRRSPSRLRGCVVASSAGAVRPQVRALTCRPVALPLRFGSAPCAFPAFSRGPGQEPAQPGSSSPGARRLRGRRLPAAQRGIYGPSSASGRCKCGRSI